MHVRVEPPVRLDLRQALALERLGEIAMDEPYAFLQLRLFVLLRRLKRPLQVVEHGQQLFDQPLVGPRDQALLVTRGPLAVVVEVGRDALEIGEVGVALGLQLGDLLSELLEGHDFLASSPSSTTS